MKLFSKKVVSKPKSSRKFYEALTDAQLAKALNMEEKELAETFGYFETTDPNVPAVVDIFQDEDYVIDTNGLYLSEYGVNDNISCLDDESLAAQFGYSNTVDGIDQRSCNTDENEHGYARDLDDNALATEHGYSADVDECFGYGGGRSSDNSCSSSETSSSCAEGGNDIDGADVDNCSSYGGGRSSSDQSSASSEASSCCSEGEGGAETSGDSSSSVADSTDDSWTHPSCDETDDGDISSSS